MDDAFIPETTTYENFKEWTELDFEKYQKWCIYHVSKGSRICRECWHLHCNPDKCTMIVRVVEQCKALIDTKIEGYAQFQAKPGIALSRVGP